ncbi:P-type conjugative transfer protein TrbL [Chelatococcus asaccharovorans]|jgi:type IV secretion system protein TrbL|uniref:Type IV secretion system protein TrbL n=1 Tax=Chelatococcus asaccharovorans TaxID=28210 RepID=A0A2V3TT63_9HYPH|nr:P-type conjugative transfer protein TrbL [Chelatococcus asaccharovorans]MBS7707936.1 P-type conjugative transfer protein TrbL [Chelatococcus asaccharovorans]PXW51186.1 type IV secretion system protein TrbL [Chelatococcus asaccharovorans]PZR92144.1 MAG: P-type conjugative transfer protein TrbL [Stutzerimonas stutzeri]
MVASFRSSKILTVAAVAGLVLWTIHPAVAADGSVLTTVENQVVTAAKGWETTVTNAAKSLFWILAGIEVGVAAVWLAIQAASIEAWFAELVRRIMFIGFFAFVLTQGPSFAKAVVDSLFEIGGGSGSASPANVFNAGLTVASAMSQKISFGVFQDNALALSASLAMIVSVIAFSLVAAIFLAVLVEMYVGLLAGMIMLGLGGSSFTKDFAIRYLVYAFSVGMKLMSLVMIAKIGSDVLIGLAQDSTVGDQYQTALAVAGIAVVIFILAMYVPTIVQGVVQGASVSGGMEVIRHGSQAASFAAGGVALGVGGASAGAAAFSAARAGGSSFGGAAMAGLRGAASAGGALASAARDKAIGAPGAYAGSLLGLANAKLDKGSSGSPTPPPEKHDK